jgi:short-subunit dehydrogenase
MSSGPTFHDLDFEVLKDQIARHSLIPLITTQIGIQNMKAANTNGRKEIGVIINASSAIVSSPMRSLALYGGSRAFTDYFTQSLGKAYLKDGIFIASLRQMQWETTDEAGFQAMAKASLKEVGDGIEIHGGTVNAAKQVVFTNVMSKIKG